MHLLSDAVSLLFETELFLRISKLMILGNIAYGYDLCHIVAALVSYTGLIETVISDVYYSLNPTGEIDFNIGDNTKTIYMIYGGSIKNYSSNRVDDIINVLTHNIKQPLESKGIVGEALDLMIEKLTPHSII